MKYMGSKNRIAKFVLPIMIKEANEKGITTWVEPFVGGANMIDKVPNNFQRIGIDYNEYLIAMWNKIMDGWIPPDFVSEEEWKDVREQMDSKYEKHYIGFVRLGCSFGADWNGGYARNVKKDKPNAELLNSTTKSYCRQSKNNILKQLPNLQGVKFINGSYDEYSDFENCLIYCDPPYEGTTSYKTGAFDHPKFWDWCRMMSKNNLVFVSEYKAPDDFICVWEGEVKTNFASQRDGATHKAVEKLFKFSPTNVQ